MKKVSYCIAITKQTCIEWLSELYVTGVNGRPMHPEGVLQLLLSGMGLLQTLPLMVTLTVEKGFLTAMSEIG